MEASIEATLSLQLLSFQFTGYTVRVRAAESHFHGKKNKFAKVVENLPTEVAHEIPDLLNVIPEENPYDMLKQTLLHRIVVSEEKKLLNISSNVSIENRNPPQLLWHILPENILQRLCLNKQPNHVTKILTPCLEEADLDKLAGTTDKICENAITHNVNTI